MNQPSPVRYKTNHNNNNNNTHNNNQNNNNNNNNNNQQTPNGQIHVRSKGNSRSSHAVRSSQQNVRHPGAGGRTVHHQNACIAAHNENHIRAAAVAAAAGPYHASLPVSYVSQSYQMNNYANRAGVYQSSPSHNSSDAINHYSPYHAAHHGHH